MTTPTTPAADKAWTMIELEKRRDRSLRRAAKIAWTVTFVLVVVLAIMNGIQIAEMMRTFAGGMLPASMVFYSAMPLIIVIGILSTLIATLATVGIFLRMRTASLTEIQLRLAALEDLMRKDDAGTGFRP